MNIWDKVKLHEGEIFKTIRGIEYSYVVLNDCILINGDKKRRITKDMFDMSMRITNPTPAKLQKANLWGPSYLYGIITDNRIIL